MFERLILNNEEIEKLNNDDLKVYFKACFYISVKYYSINYLCDLRYEYFPPYNVPHCSLDLAREFEQDVVRTLQSWVYEISIYDIDLSQDKPQCKSIINTFSLLLFILNGEHYGLTSSDGYEKWKENSLKYRGIARKHPFYKNKMCYK